MAGTRTIKFHTITEGLDAFRAQLAVTPVAPGAIPSALKLEEIATCETVFQQRETKLQAHASETHIRILAAALSSGQVFDPLLVWWNGQDWVLLDGHHRVQAYERRKHIGLIPVDVFSGTPEEALRESAQRNSQNKLPMTKEEKQGTAIKLTLLTSSSKAEIVKASGVSNGTVAEIRRITKILAERGVSIPTMARMSWKDLREMAEDKTKVTMDFDEYTQRKAEEIRQALIPVISKNLISNSDAMALALSQFPEDFVRRAMNSQHWSVDWQERVEGDDEEMDDDY